MLKRLNYTVSQDLIKEAIGTVDFSNFRESINEPTGDFFYDIWKIKSEYKDTVWDQILNTLPFNIGEARIIVLQPATCYQSHSDIDDRYHLNLQAEKSYLIDLDESILHEITTDGFWYEMNAGKIHTAANFGRYIRVQLVVRKLLTKGHIKYPLKVKITSIKHGEDDARFLFDNHLSNWLNQVNKLEILNNFRFINNEIFFEIEREYLNELKERIIDGFKLEILL